MYTARRSTYVQVWVVVWTSIHCKHINTLDNGQLYRHVLSDLLKTFIEQGEMSNHRKTYTEQSKQNTYRLTWARQHFQWFILHDKVSRMYGNKYLKKYALTVWLIYWLIDCKDEATYSVPITITISAIFENTKKRKSHFLY